MLNKTKLDNESHKLLVLWAALCAEHVVHAFEKNHNDDRPRKEIEASRAWVRGEIKMSEARKYAFGSHSAARDASSSEAIAAARAAGHAAATTHVPSHAKYAASYALKAATDYKKEREWQLTYLPESCIYLIDLKE